MNCRELQTYDDVVLIYLIFWFWKRTY